jgi:hypothetical protein
MNLVETIKSLQRDVQIYKVDNERLLKAKEQQDGFDINLLSILDIIENKIDKEIESIKPRSHRFLARREESRSASRHHHDSPRNLARRAYNNPIISLVRKCKRKSGVD